MIMMHFISTSVTAICDCLLYTSDAADDLTRVDLGGRRIIKKNSTDNKSQTLQIKVCEVSIKYVNIAMMISRWLFT